MSDETFEGFVPPIDDYFRMPNEWINICAKIDNLSELKVVQYVLRHTWGYQEYDGVRNITVDEFMDGRKRRDGTRMDNGTGLSEPSVKDGIKRAVKHGYVVCTIDDKDKARIKKYYGLRMIATSQHQGASILPSETRGQVSCPQGGTSLPPEDKNVTPRGQETIPRTEKDTIERHLEKNTLERQESNAPASLSAFAERKKATNPELPAITPEMLAEKVIPPKIKLPSKQTPPQSQVKGTPDVAPSASVASTAQAGAPAKKKVTHANEPQQVPKCSTKEIQARINAHRGYALEEEVEIIRERKAIKTWCNLHELADYDTTMQHLKHDPYWGKSENYYRIGGLTLLKETPKALAEIAKRQNGRSPETLGNYHYYRPQAAGGGR